MHPSSTPPPAPDWNVAELYPTLIRMSGPARVHALSVLLSSDNAAIARAAAQAIRKGDAEYPGSAK